MPDISGSDPDDLSWVRPLFPALNRPAAPGTPPPIFFDNPGGTQVPRSVAEAVMRYLTEDNANTGGPFPTSQRTDAMLEAARAALADFLNAPSPRQIAFGPNMTELTFAVSRAFGRLLSPGDEIVTTVLDHDGNIAPWLALERERGAVVRAVDIRLPDCALDMDQLAALLSPRTRLLAIGYASNATGTINDVATATRLAHDRGAWVYVDAVQYAPHGPIDVQALECDFLVCSAYKFFGPHVGVLYGRADRLAELPVDKVRPLVDEAPWRIEQGTLNHEGIAGAAAAVAYLARVGRGEGAADGTTASRRGDIVAGMETIRAYERALCERLITGLEALPGARIWGITDRARLGQRVPTVSFTWDALSPAATAAHLGRHGVCAWYGDYYAMALMERLGLAPEGAIRLGLAHYNTAAEVDRVLDLLDAAARSRRTAAVGGP